MSLEDIMKNDPSLTEEDAKIVEEAEKAEALKTEAEGVNEEKPPVAELKPEEPPIDNGVGEKKPEGNDPEDGPAEPKPERMPKSIPVPKYQDEKHKRQKAELRVAELEEEIKNSKTTPEDVEDIKALAEKHGVDEDLVKDLIATVSKKFKLPEDVQKKLDLLDQKEREVAEEQGFNKEFEELSKEYPETAEFKDKVKEIAYTEGFEKKSLFEIFFRHIKPTIPEKKKTAEDTKSGVSRGTGGVDYNNVTEKDIEQMSPEEFNKYSEWAEKNLK